MYRFLKTIFILILAFSICVGIQMLGEWLLIYSIDLDNFLLWIGILIGRIVLAFKLGGGILAWVHDTLEKNYVPSWVIRLSYLPYGYMIYVVPIGSAIVDFLYCF